MKRVEINNVEIVFKNNDILGSKTWFTNLTYRQQELYFEFDERTILLNGRPGEIKIDENLLIDVVKHVLDNLGAIKLKGVSFLTELHKQVFGDEVLPRDKGYFQLETIELKSVDDFFGNRAAGHITNFEYDVSFFLESELNIVMDPYYSYKARFSLNYNRLTIVGVSRIG